MINIDSEMEQFEREYDEMDCIGDYKQVSRYHDNFANQLSPMNNPKVVATNFDPIL